MSEHDNGINRKPTTANPEPIIQINAGHCRVTNAREVRRRDGHRATCFNLHTGRKIAFQCLLFDDADNAFDDMADGTLVTVIGQLHPFAWVKPGVLNPEIPTLWVNYIEVETTPEEVKRKTAIHKATAW